MLSCGSRRLPGGGLIKCGDAPNVLVVVGRRLRLCPGHRPGLGLGHGLGLGVAEVSVAQVDQVSSVMLSQ